MARRLRWKPRLPQRPLPLWLVCGIALLVAIGLAVGLIRLAMYQFAVTTLQPQPSLGVATLRDILTLAFAAVAGIGGVIALVVTYRRQQVAESTATFTAHDASERRVTELYMQAVERLGHERAPVRLGALYALERLGINHPEHRQTIVNVLCAYLRMPIEDPPSNLEVNAAHEQEVRSAAQDILVRHLSCTCDATTNSAGNFWPRIELNLERAHLVDFRARGLHSATAKFTGATFTGSTFVSICTPFAEFRHATFESRALFSSRGSSNGHLDSFCFDGWDSGVYGMDFYHAIFKGPMEFVGKGIEGEEIIFSEAEFHGVVYVNAPGLAFHFDHCEIMNLRLQHKWPAGWGVIPDPHRQGLQVLVRTEDAEPVEPSV